MPWQAQHLADMPLPWQLDAADDEEPSQRSGHSNASCTLTNSKVSLNPPRPCCLQYLHMLGTGRQLWCMAPGFAGEASSGQKAGYAVPVALTEQQISNHHTKAAEEP